MNSSLIEKIIAIEGQINWRLAHKSRWGLQLQILLHLVWLMQLNWQGYSELNCVNYVRELILCSFHFRHHSYFLRQSIAPYQYSVLQAPRTKHLSPSTSQLTRKKCFQ